MSIRWDSVLARHLAAELDEALAGARLRALRLDGAARDLVLLFRDRTLVWRLHPDRGWLRSAEALTPEPSDLRFPARVRAVSAPPDERLVRLELLPERGRRGRVDLVVELMGNRMNAVVTEGDDAVIRHVLVRREGARPLRVGARYGAPRGPGRTTDATLDAWLGALGPIPAAERAHALVRRFAWTSPLNADTILGRAGAPAESGPEAPSAPVADASSAGETALTSAFRRWRAMAEGVGARALLLRADRGLQPYPFALAGVSGAPADTLLSAFEAAAADAEERGDAPLALTVSPALVSSLDEAVRHHERRVSRLHAQLRDVEDPKGLRGLGDLILARLGEIRAGASEVELLDFDGNGVRVALDPALRPHENADRYYDRAGRAERARARLPGLIQEAEDALLRIEGLRERALAGDVESEEVRAALPSTPTRGQRARPGEAPPYRTFRSSGGLEIRVGRGARHNDDLTFRHSAPGDVWLHARHTAGAHVILRWSDDGAPPARDLREAATLAALHSKARTSGSVPVDWTRRKHVRKPRGAPAGRVLADRLKTVFVEPDERLLDELAEPE